MLGELFRAFEKNSIECIDLYFTMQTKDFADRTTLREVSLRLAIECGRFVLAEMVS